jgi:benzoyl-CoA reductase/2-hydroxyglutaryl-CoA dehydratase subunit BcrC/BadD/HgdB
MPREIYTQALAAWIEDLATRRNTSETADRRRLMVLGSISDDIDLIQMIEEDDRVVVAAENLCFGIRHAGHAIDTQGDPVEALARGYLDRSICPRMFGRYRQRLAAVLDVIARARIDAVVLQNIRFCDLHGSENSLFERDLEARGIPCLKIEREYGPLVEKGRIRMRLDAFLERIA